MTFDSVFEALTHTVYASGRKQGDIAAALNKSPSDLSRMCTHPEDENRRTFDLYLLPKLLVTTNDLSILETIAGQMGCRVVKVDGLQAAEEIDDVITVLERAKRILKGAK